MKRALGITLLLAACARDNPEFGLGPGEGTGGGVESTGEMTGVSGNTGMTQPGDDDDDDDAEDTSGGGNDTADLTCAPGESCLPIPKGWEGPVAVHSTDDEANDPAGCDVAPLAGLLRRGVAGAIDLPTECCTCNKIATTCSVALQRYEDVLCENEGPGTFIDDCTEISALEGSAAISFTANVQTPGSCAGEVIDPQPAGGSTEFVCAVEVAADCGGGACVPDSIADPGMAYPCIIRSTPDSQTMPCPGDWVPYASIREVVNNYSCDGVLCPCQGTDVNACNPTLVLHDDLVCGTEVDTIAGPGQCINTDDVAAAAAMIGETDPGPDCAPLMASPPSGDLEENNWAQICCKA